MYIYDFGDKGTEKPEQPTPLDAISENIKAMTEKYSTGLSSLQMLILEAEEKEEEA